MSIVQFHQVVKRYGSLTVLDGIDLTIASGEIVVLVGPSGSGKSTLLRCINALETIQQGELIVDGINARGSAADVRQIRLEAGMVFQQFNLFPHMTATENVMYGPLKARGMTMIVVTHEISFARDVGSRLLFIDQGKILHDGNPRALLENPPSERLAVFLQHIR